MLTQNVTDEGKSTSKTHKKSLIIIEKDALSGETAKGIILAAQQSILTDSARDPSIQSYIQKLKILNKQEQQLESLREERGQLESSYGEDYEQNSDWIAINSTIKTLDGELASLRREANLLQASALPIALDIMKQSGFDILTYNGADASAGRTIVDKARRDPSLIEAIQRLDSNITYDSIVIGGGHGSADVLAGLHKDFVQDVILEMSAKKLSGKLVCLGSCESATHGSYMHPILEENGMIVSYLGDCTNNFALTAVEYSTENEIESFIDIDAYAEDNEANQKAAAIALFHKDEVFAFELAPEAKKNPDNISHWDNSFRNMYLSRVSDSDLQVQPKILRTPISHITLMGTESSTDGLSALQKYAESLPDSTDIQVESFKRELVIATAQSLEAAEDEEELMEILQENIDDSIITGFETPEAYIDHRVELIPRLKQATFSVDTQTRLTAVNHAVSQVIAPGGVAPAAGLTESPIPPEVATKGLTRARGALKALIDTDEPQAKQSIKIKGG